MLLANTGLEISGVMELKQVKPQQFAGASAKIPSNFLFNRQ
jgi:hypothetical protein